MSPPFSVLARCALEFVSLAIPDGRTYEHRFSCGEVHPGLCARRDAAIYDDALSLAKSIEACLGQPHLHRLLKFFDPDQASSECP